MLTDIQSLINFLSTPCAFSANSNWFGVFAFGGGTFTVSSTLRPFSVKIFSTWFMSATLRCDFPCTSFIPSIWPPPTILPCTYSSSDPIHPLNIDANSISCVTLSSGILLMSGRFSSIGWFGLMWAKSTFATSKATLAIFPHVGLAGQKRQCSPASNLAFGFSVSRMPGSSTS